MWTLKLDVIQLINEHGIHADILNYFTPVRDIDGVSERQICREKVGELVAEKIMYVADNMNKHEYVPKMPSQSDLDLVFDTGFSDVQPYLFKVGMPAVVTFMPQFGLQ